MAAGHQRHTAVCLRVLGEEDMLLSAAQAFAVMEGKEALTSFCQRCTHLNTHISAEVLHVSFPQYLLKSIISLLLELLLKVFLYAFSRGPTNLLVSPIQL